MFALMNVLWHEKYVAFKRQWLQLICCVTLENHLSSVFFRRILSPDFAIIKQYISITYGLNLILSFSVEAYTSSEEIPDIFDNI